MTGYTDGACRVSNPGLCSAAFAVFDEDLRLVYQQARCLGPELFSNNVAEYSGLLDLLQWAEAKQVRELQIFCDSKLVVEQVNYRWRCDKPDLKPLMTKAYALLTRGGHTLIHIRGHQGIPGNELCDRLCNEVLDEYQEENEWQQGLTS